MNKEEIEPVCDKDPQGCWNVRCQLGNKCRNTALQPKEPEQEPVAWMFQHDETGRMNYVSNDGIHDPTMFLGMNPRYALVCPLYTTPPQRKPLTDEQIKDIRVACGSPLAIHIEFARAIESAHGIKE